MSLESMEKPPGAVLGLIITVLLYAVTIIVWGIRQEGKISTLEVERASMEHRLEVIEESGSKTSRAQLAAITTKMTELEKGFTPYGVINLEKRVNELEISRAFVISSIEERMKRSEVINVDHNAKLPLLDQRLVAAEEKIRDWLLLQRRVIQIESMLDNQRLVMTGGRRTYEDHW